MSHYVYTDIDKAERHWTEKTCPSGKPCFGTKGEIKTYIRLRNLRNGGDGFKYYYCPTCGCYHLTTYKTRDGETLKRHAMKYNRLAKKRVDEDIFDAFGVYEGKQTYRKIRYHQFYTETHKAV